MLLQQRIQFAAAAMQIADHPDPSPRCAIQGLVIHRCTRPLSAENIF
ncbi:hypothetical protein LD112_08460 [Pantoea agglomerans]|nr:hypothetical protein [Pantoea agglomerans]